MHLQNKNVEGKFLSYKITIIMKKHHIQRFVWCKVTNAMVYSWSWPDPILYGTKEPKIYDRSMKLERKYRDLNALN